MIKPKPHNQSFGYNAVHIVFVTKYRHEVINKEIESRLIEMFSRLCSTQDSELLECKADLGKLDHIHLLVDLAPRLSLGKLCNILKTISSREIRKEFATELKPYYCGQTPRRRQAQGNADQERKPKFGKQGYGYTTCGSSLCAGGAAIDVLVRYIENQGYDD
ncbi:IS200/IS605 family transposase [Pleurocapsa sp. PCC 7319]|uniref:IS200/IS605 family transposase n=1 Tax=Pleurocapsa sp. PCC 7319 TaxID=118161 RepID=UPI00047661E8|nr:IS200/IS605 family transposase [Pleurocapsa sp. PCC 7319]